MHAAPGSSLRTEAEIPNPRQQDVQHIKELEGQIRALMSALNSAAKEKLLQNPNWRPPTLSSVRACRDFCVCNICARGSLLFERRRSCMLDFSVFLIRQGKSDGDACAQNVIAALITRRICDNAERRHAHVLSPPGLTHGILLPDTLPHDRSGPRRITQVMLRKS